MREKQKMSEYIETVSTEDANAVIDSKLRKVFDGRIVRKDLTKKMSPFMSLSFFLDSIAVPMTRMSLKPALQTSSGFWLKTTSAPTRRRRSFLSSVSEAAIP